MLTSKTKQEEKSMNKSQTSYLMKRIDGVAGEKINAILTEENACMAHNGCGYGKLDGMFNFAIHAKEVKGDIDKAIKKVGIKLLPVKQIEEQIKKDLCCSWRVPGVDLLVNRAEINEEKTNIMLVRVKKAQARMKKLKNEVTKVKDKIMLGDEKDALKSLETFANKTF